MAYVSGYEYDIFISYAPGDDRPPHGTRKGWVTTLITELKNELERKLGHITLYSTYHVPGNFQITPEMLRALRKSATLIVILSEGYLGSEWCQQEKNEFLNIVKERERPESRVFVVERDPIESDRRPPEFRYLRGYWFFEENSVTGYAQALGWPQLQSDDRKYYDMLNVLSCELAAELRNLNTETKTGTEAVKESTDSQMLPTVLLAEVTGDLYFVRENVKCYLKQANIRVVPETNYPREPQAFQEAVSRNLEESQTFVQLVSDFPFQSYPDLPQGYVRCQYELALAQKAKKEILQWRSPELDLESVQDPEQSDFLHGETVFSVGIEEFKAEIVKRALPSKPRSIAPETHVPFVFVKSDTSDELLAKDICRILGETFHVRFSSPRPSANRKLVERLLLRCDGFLIIYGNADIEWVEMQYLDVFDMLPKRKRPVKACAIYDGPPKDKPELSFGAPELRILQCRDYINEEKIRGFVEALRTGEAA